MRLIRTLESIGLSGEIVSKEPESFDNIVTLIKIKKDIDRDGIADEWELKNKLDPNNALDANAINSSGYTNLEAYLHELISGIKR